jgi:hypothetical protein
MAQQAALSEVNQGTAKKTVRYSIGRNPVDVLKYALPIIRKYHPNAKVGPLDTTTGREPKLVITDPGKKPVKIPITNMSMGEFYNMLLTENVSNVDFSFVDFPRKDVICWDDNWIRIAYSETADPLKQFQISCVLGFEDYLIKKRPYIKIEVSPATAENKNNLTELAEELKRI